MKKQINKLSILALSLFLLVSIAYGAIIADSAKISVTLISQEPDPSEPGELLDLRFKVENLGGEGTGDIIFELIEDSPFTLYKGEAVRNIGSMQAYQRAEEGIIVHYELKVDENAIEGDNFVDIRYKLGENRPWVYVRDFTVRIRTRDLVVSVESIESNPETITPGKDFELSLTLKNNADSLINDVVVSLDLEDEDIPFAPSKSTAEKQIYQIRSRTGKIIKFDLVALPDAERYIYKIPINISYTDETGMAYTKDDIISLKVSSTPDLLVNVDSSTIQGQIKSGEVVIRIVNRGLTNIKLLTAKIESDDNFDVISQQEVYVGNIDSDDYETVDYKLTVNSFEKTVELPLEITYMDSTNKKHQQSISLELRTNSPSKSSTMISGIIGGLIKLAILVGLVYLGYRIYKRFRKKKKA